jgi:hypothetical protein
MSLIALYDVSNKSWCKAYPFLHPKTNLLLENDLVIKYVENYLFIQQLFAHSCTVGPFNSIEIK